MVNFETETKQSSNVKYLYNNKDVKKAELIGILKGNEIEEPPADKQIGLVASSRNGKNHHFKTEKSFNKRQFKATEKTVNSQKYVTFTYF